MVKAMGLYHKFLMQLQLDAGTKPYKIKNKNNLPLLLFITAELNATILGFIA